MPKIKEKIDKRRIILTLSEMARDLKHCPRSCRSWWEEQKLEALNSAIKLLKEKK